MPILQKISSLGSPLLGRGAELWVEYNVVGSYEKIDEETGLVRTVPKRDLLRWIVKSPFTKTFDPKSKNRGNLRGIMPKEFSRSGQRIEMQDKLMLSRDYTIGTLERNRLRSYMEGATGVVNGEAFPTLYELGWEREQHGPMSPTLEDEFTAVATTNVATLTGNFAGPTSGNLLVACGGGGYLFLSSNHSEIAAHTTGWTDDVVDDSSGTFTIAPVISSKTAGASEPTAVVLGATSGSDERSLWGGEYSGMAASSQFDVGAGTYSSVNNITSRSTNTTAITAQADSLVVALWVYSMSNGSVVNPAYSNSFTIEGVSEGTPGQTDVGIRVATKYVLATGTQESTFTLNTPGESDICANIAVYKSAAAGGAATPKGPFSNVFAGPFGGPL